MEEALLDSMYQTCNNIQFRSTMDQEWLFISKATGLGIIRAFSEDQNHCSLKKWIQNNNVLRQFLNNLLEVAVHMYVPDTHTLPTKQAKNKDQHEILQSRFQMRSENL